jgi:hypothetical protein
MVEKYQTIKMLIENGDMGGAASRGPPSVTTYSQHVDVVSPPNSRTDQRVEIHVSVSTDSPCGDRSRSATPAPAMADMSTSTIGDALLSPTNATRDEAIETDITTSEYDDELERLRRERRRILDMLGKDQMPSKLQVELAEAQMNYLIRQTDT